MSAKPTRTNMLNQRSGKPNALSKVPTLIGWNQAAGMTERTALAKTADTCVWVKVETSCPKPVVENTYSSVPSASAPKEPWTGTWNTSSDISSRRANVDIPTATYGTCLPARNSNLL